MLIFIHSYTSIPSPPLYTSKHGDIYKYKMNRQFFFLSFLIFMGGSSEAHEAPGSAHVHIQNVNVLLTLHSVCINNASFLQLVKVDV